MQSALPPRKHALTSALMNRHFNHRMGNASLPAASLRISPCTNISIYGEEDLFSLLVKGAVNSDCSARRRAWRCEILQARVGASRAAEGQAPSCTSARLQ